MNDTVLYIHIYIYTYIYPLFQPTCRSRAVDIHGSPVVRVASWRVVDVLSLELSLGLDQVLVSFVVGLCHCLGSFFFFFGIAWWADVMLRMLCVYYLELTR